MSLSLFEPLAAAAALVVALSGFARMLGGSAWAIPTLGSAALSMVAVGWCLKKKTTPARSAAVVSGTTAAVVILTVLAGSSGSGFLAAVSLIPDQVHAAVFWSKAPVAVAVTPGLTAGLVVLAAALGAVTRVGVAKRSWWAPVPAVAAFCALCAMSRPLHAQVYVAAFSVSALLWWAARRAEHPDTEPANRRRLMVIALVVAVSAVIFGAVTGSMIPGAKDRALLPSFRPINQDTLSPLVKIGGQITGQSDTDLFWVETDNPDPSPWRVNTLSRFDGRTWFESNVGGFDPPRPLLGGSEYTYRIHLQNWDFDAVVPGPIRPIRFASKSIIADWATGRTYYSKIPNEDGTSRFTGVEFSGDVLAAAPTETLQAVDVNDPDLATFLDLPATFATSSASVLAHQIASEGNGSDYDTLKRMEAFFASGAFTYDLGADFTSEPDPLSAFLTTKSGYCQQFAGAFAAMSRSLGFPTRVAVGYSAGVRDATNPNRYHVTGKQAHAWPEVWFGWDIGWVEFEPTPATSGITPAAVTTPDGAPTSSTVPPSPTTNIAAAKATETTNVPSAATKYLDGLGALIVSLAGIVAVDRIARRHRNFRFRSLTSDGHARLAWEDCVTTFGKSTFAKSADMTRSAWAARIESITGSTGLADLARCLDAADFGDIEITADDAANAQSALWSVRRTAASHPAFAPERKPRFPQMFPHQMNPPAGTSMVLANPE